MLRSVIDGVSSYLLRLPNAKALEVWALEKNLYYKYLLIKRVTLSGLSLAIKKKTGEKIPAISDLHFFSPKKNNFFSIPSTIFKSFTPQKSNIDTKKWPYLKGATFSKPSVWVSMLVFVGVYLYFQGSVAESKSLCESTAEADDQWLHSKAFPELATDFAAHLPQWVARHALGIFLQRAVFFEDQGNVRCFVGKSALEHL